MHKSWLNLFGIVNHQLIQFTFISHICKLWGCRDNLTHLGMSTNVVLHRRADNIRWYWCYAVMLKEFHAQISVNLLPLSFDGILTNQLLDPVLVLKSYTYIYNGWKSELMLVGPPWHPRGSLHLLPLFGVLLLLSMSVSCPSRADSSEYIGQPKPLVEIGTYVHCVYDWWICLFLFISWL